MYIFPVFSVYCRSQNQTLISSCVNSELHYVSHTVNRLCVSESPPSLLLLVPSSFGLKDALWCHLVAMRRETDHISGTPWRKRSFLPVCVSVCVYVSRNNTHTLRGSVRLSERCCSGCWRVLTCLWLHWSLKATHNYFLITYDPSAAPRFWTTQHGGSTQSAGLSFILIGTKTSHKFGCTANSRLWIQKLFMCGKSYLTHQHSTDHHSLWECTEWKSCRGFLWFKPLQKKGAFNFSGLRVCGCTFRAGRWNLDMSQLDLSKKY